MAKTAQQAAQNWQSAMTNPQTAAKYKQGIMGTTENPMQKAASQQAQSLYATNTALAVSSGKMAARLNAVPMSVWQNNAANIGSTQLSVGAQKGLSKVQSHFQKWMPIYQQASAAAAAIPKDGTIGTALAKVQAAIQIMKNAALQGA